MTAKITDYLPPALTFFLVLGGAIYGYGQLSGKNTVNTKAIEILQEKTDQLPALQQKLDDVQRDLTEMRGDIKELLKRNR